MKGAINTCVFYNVRETSFFAKVPDKFLIAILWLSDNNEFHLNHFLTLPKTNEGHYIGRNSGGCVG